MELIRLPAYTGCLASIFSEDNLHTSHDSMRHQRLILKWLVGTRIIWVIISKLMNRKNPPETSNILQPTSDSIYLIIMCKRISWVCGFSAIHCKNRDYDPSCWFELDGIMTESGAKRLHHGKWSNHPLTLKKPP